MRNVNEKKVKNLADTPETSDLLLYAHPAFVHLRSILVEVETERIAGWQDVKTQAEALDHALYTWRCIHYGIALNYLPPAIPGTGGSNGAPYLAAHFKHKILDESRHCPTWALTGRNSPITARPILSQFN